MKRLEIFILYTFNQSQTAFINFIIMSDYDLKIFFSSHSVHKRPNQLRKLRYLGLEYGECPCVKIVSVHVNGSPRDILVARDYFVDRSHAQLPSTINLNTLGSVFSCEPGTVLSPTP